MIEIHPNYITDLSGIKISAVLPINEFLSLIEELEDIKLYDESKRENDPAISNHKAMVMLEKERKKLRK